MRELFWLLHFLLDCKPLQGCRDEMPALFQPGLKCGSHSFRSVATIPHACCGPILGLGKFSNAPFKGSHDQSLVMRRCTYQILVSNFKPSALNFKHPTDVQEYRPAASELRTLAGL